MDLLVVGHSHTVCMAAASREMPGISVINILRAAKGLADPAEIADRIAEVVGGDKPAAVCLCIRGNHHNMLGLVEHPQPFAIGHETLGATSDDDDRHFIPYQLMFDNLYRNRMGDMVLGRAILERFPGASRLYVNPPPPKKVWTTGKMPPGIAEVLHRGASPDALRAQLYKIQTATMAKMAAELGATFVAQTDAVQTEDGFLRPEFETEETTHANAAYGAVMLDEILKHARAAVPS